MSTNIKNSLLKLVEYIPLITGIIVVLGCIRLMTYYAIFKLSIFTYTEFGDFLSEGIADFTKFFLYTLFGMCIPTLSKNPFRNEVIDGDLDYQILKSNSEKFLYFFSNISLGGIIITFIMGIIYYFAHNLGIYNKCVTILTIGCFAFLYISLQIPRLYLNHYLYKFDKTIFIITTVGIFYTLTVFYLSFLAGLDKRYYHGVEDNVALINGKTIKSQSKYYYIGQTKSYIFFHNDNKNSNDAYLKSQIAKISIQE